MKALQIHQLRRSIEQLQRRVRQIEMTVEGDRLLGFANMCYRYFEAGAKEHREIKVRLLAAACAHCADATNTDPYDTQLEFFDVVERLQPFHMVILKHVEELERSERAKAPDKGWQGTSFETILSAGLKLPEPNKLWLTKALITLNQVNTIIVWGGAPLTRGKDGRSYTVVEPLHVTQHASMGISQFGTRLLRYVEAALDDDPNQESSPEGAC